MDREQKNIIFIVVGVVGLILIIIAGFYFFQENRFYTFSSPSGYSIDYPGKWSVQKDPELVNVIFGAPPSSELDTFMENVNVNVQELGPRPLGLKKYSEKALDQMKAVFGPNLVILEENSIYVAGMPGFKLVFVGKGPQYEFQIMSVWTLKGDKAYQITYTATTLTYEDYMKQVEQMIGSFRIN